MRIAQLSIAAGMILTLFPGSGLAQQDAPVPTFSAGTRVVEVDVVARSKGAPATGFYPVQESQDGSRHNLKVEVARPGVSVRYRENYFASKTASATNERPTLEELLRNPLDATQLELLAETAPDPARPGFRQVRVTVDLHGVQLERRNDTWVGAVDVSFFVEGAKSARTLRIVRIVAQDPATGAAGSVRVPLGQR